MEGYISVNGVITTPEKASVSALDRGLLFADNVFEVFVGFYDHVLEIQAHLDRLRRSAEEIVLPIPWSDHELKFELEALAAQIKSPKKYLRLLITRGNGLGLDFSDDLEPTKIIYAFTPKIESDSLYLDGIKLKRRRNLATERGPSAKTGNYLKSIVAMRKARQSGFDDILWTNGEGELTECSTANIFLLGREGDLVEIATPPAQSGILLGITRERMITLLNNAKIPVTERVIFADEIPRFDEAFTCSTIRGLVPVAQIDDHQLHTTRKNGIFQNFERLFLSWVESELGFRVDWNTGRKI